MFIKCLTTGVIIEYKTEIMGDQNFYIGNRGSAFLDNVITGFIIYIIYKGLYSYRKWFGVLSFQRNNRHNENGQSNNENPLYMRGDILVSADPFLDRKATLQQNTTSSDFLPFVVRSRSIVRFPHHMFVTKPLVRIKRTKDADTLLNYLPV